LSSCINKKVEHQHYLSIIDYSLFFFSRAWHGDESATIHLARVIGLSSVMISYLKILILLFEGIDPQVEQNAFIEKKITERATSAKKTVTIANNDDIIFKVKKFFLIIFKY
jgi:hypothetical protein